MIRFGLAYCPCCTRKLIYDRQADYFWCDCEGWAHLTFRDREKEIISAERYDRRSPRKVIDYGEK